MKAQNELALIVGYYLSRLDKSGYLLLGYSNFSGAVKKIGEILNVKPNTIKNMRDEFDPYHQNRRIGWKRELRGSRQKTLKAFQDTDDDALVEIVKEILDNQNFKKTEEYQDIHSIFKDKKKYKGGRSPVFILRGPTGKAAEAAFIEYFKKNSMPVLGELIDTRDLGCGYDFEIRNKEGSFFIEVKGLSSTVGGVSFTNKEWRKASIHKDKYYLIIVSNISVSPEFRILCDPASKLKVKKSIFTTIQVNWSVSKKSLEEVN